MRKHLIALAAGSLFTALLIAIPFAIMTNDTALEIARWVWRLMLFFGTSWIFGWIIIGLWEGRKETPK